MKHMERFFQDVVDKGGEGIILRDPIALLQPGRSLGYLKHKVCFPGYIFLLLFFFTRGCTLLFLRNSGMQRRKLWGKQDNISGNVNCTHSLYPPPPFSCICYADTHQMFNTCLSIRPNGVRFTASAGTAEFARRWDPQPGEIVTFKHRGFLLNSKKPKLPTLHRMRTDITWDHVLSNWKEGKQNNKGTKERIDYLSHPSF